MNFCLVVPTGLRKEILPWGAYCIQSYVQAHEPGIRTTILDLRGEDFTRDLQRRYGPSITRVLENLKLDQPIVIGQTAEAALGVVAGLGERFIPIARDAGLFTSRLAARRISSESVNKIKLLAGEVEDYFRSRIVDEIERNGEMPTVWGLSVYDSSIISVISCARVIRKLDPVSPIILGGGYFNAEFAERLVEGMDPALVDGVIVGRGEAAVLKLLRAYRNGTPIEQIQVPGLYSRRSPHWRDNPETESIAQHVPPEDATTTSWMPVNPVVQENIIHIMPQVGCSWGRCTFCDHVDKDQPAFEVLREDFFPRLTETIAALSGDAGPITTTPGHPTLPVVWLDGDEISPETLIAILRHLAEINQTSGRTAVRGWLQVKKFTEDLARTLFECRHKIQGYIICNAESFNFDALRAMKKGHTPLQAAYVLKSVIDTGHVPHTNIFSYYPREAFRGVKEEVELVGRIYHLICSPKSDVDVRSYAANEFDEIFYNQERFQFRVRRRKGDVWLRKAFDVDLPLQHFSAVAQENRPFSLEAVVVGCYARAIDSVMLLVRRHRLLRSLDPRRGRFRHILGRLQLAEILAAARAVERVTILYLITRLAGKDYWRRGQMWLRIKRNASLFRKTRLGSAGQRNDKPSYFYLRGGILSKNYQGWGRKENWQYNLNDDELTVLRYLYKVRKRRALFDRFRESIGDAEMEKILRRQTELGSVVESHGSLLCVANDPEYWEFKPGRWD